MLTPSADRDGGRRGARIRMAFQAASTLQAQNIRADLERRYGHCEIDQGDVIVAIGGDGFMLACLHQHAQSGIPIYGVRTSPGGFLMNEMEVDALREKVENATLEILNPLRMIATDVHGHRLEALAFNDVVVRRQSPRQAWLGIAVNGSIRLDHLTSDGILLATPLGSTAYNLSAGGPVIPRQGRLLALTPICAQRPRHWRGALLSCHATVSLRVRCPTERPVSVVAGQSEMSNVAEVDIRHDPDIRALILVDRDQSLAERSLAEQFTV